MNSEIVTAAPPTNPKGVIIFAPDTEKEAHHDHALLCWIEIENKEDRAGLASQLARGQ